MSADSVMIEREDKGATLEVVKGPSGHPLDRDTFEFQTVQCVDQW